MLTFSREINQIEHPLVHSFRLNRDFTAMDKIRTRLVIEAKFDFDNLTDKKTDANLMGLLADLKKLLRDIEKQTGQLDYIDICPLHKRQKNTRQPAI